MPLILNVNHILLYNHMMCSLIPTVLLTFSFDVASKKIIAHLETVALDKYKLRIPYNDQRSDNCIPTPTAKEVCQRDSEKSKVKPSTSCILQIEKITSFGFEKASLNAAVRWGEYGKNWMRLILLI